MNHTVFTINIIQDENGQISVLSEAAGDQPEAYEIGIEIMANLKIAAAYNPHMKMRVQPLTYSDSLQ